jgi:UDP-2-acetamido-2-deoxy-ribo-hexuluronate aminotransferase
VQAHLKEKGIATAVHYPVPLHLQPVFADIGYKEGNFPVSEKVSKEVLSLPAHPYLSQQDIVSVVDAVGEALSL